MAVYSPHERFARKFVRPMDGRTLIVGSKLYAGREDRRSLYRDAVGVDMLPGDGVDVVFNLENPGAVTELGTFAHIECWSVLEHSTRPWLVAKNIESLMQKGGTIYLTVPFAWRLHSYPQDFWRFSPRCVRDVLFPRIDWLHLMMADEKLRENDRTPVLGKGAVGQRWIARQEVLGFGVRT